MCTHSMSKSANYRIRVEPELHQDFLDACKASDRPAAQVIREFMRDYVVRFRESRQAELFPTQESEIRQQGGR